MRSAHSAHSVMGGGTLGNRRWLGAALVCAVGFSAFPVFAAPGDELKTLVEQGKFAEAYAAAEKQPEHVGNPGFDMA